MAITNHERVGRALHLLKTGLGPFIEREMESVHRENAHAEALRLVGEDKNLAKNRPRDWDAAALLKLMWEAWNDVFRKTLGPAERSLVQELKDTRNRWAHQRTFTSDDADRAIDSAERLLTAVSAPEAEQVRKHKMELRRTMFDEQARSERRKITGTTIESTAAVALKPWRDIVTPHPDVASGRYQQAEFAADLWQVHVGEGTDEYRDPVEFFRRTYLTDSLRRLLASALERIAKGGGDPVVQLQTNFGGGKTHSMLALYHVFSTAKASDLAGIDDILAQVGVQKIPSAKRVVLVGNKISPGNPSKKKDGTVVRTLWGELAWQLGGTKAFARVAQDDAKATSPGDTLRMLFNEFGPCVILVDEWVAYARQLHDQSDLPAGGFETQFSFAQALTESARAAKNCLLVISLPASETPGSPHAQIDDVEVGGQRGRDALNRLRNVVGRLESSWRAASAEEGFEIVRRRLFQPLTDTAHRDRDVVARAFADMYRGQQQEFPTDCRSADYEKRIRAAYPIHPEIFDRLYTDWSTLLKFQRTRGVLRLMAAVIHSLWEKGDRNPLILPANIPIDDPRVQNELTRYLPDNWTPVIEKDVDGASSLPVQLDASIPALGRFAAARRVARTIYLGSAPTAGSAHRGLEDRQVNLGCTMAGESTGVFGDALRRLSGAATFLYHDGVHYWYDTKATVTKVAEDRAGQIKRQPDAILAELERRVRENLRASGPFPRVHAMPQSSADIPDDTDARLVVLGPDQPYAKEGSSLAERRALELLESRGNSPRIFRNTLVFLAVDQSRYAELEDGIARYLAWSSIVRDKEQLDLTAQQLRQAQEQQKTADSVVSSRIPETFQWVLVPEQQKDPGSPIKWAAIRLTGQEPLAERVGKRLQKDELLLSSVGATTIRKYLEDVPLWRGDYVPIRQLAEDFAKYLYLPRLASTRALCTAIENGLALLTWESDSFAYAEGYDAATGRYRGLQSGRRITIAENDNGLLVQSSVASEQLRKETVAVTASEPQAEPGEKPVSPAEPVRRAKLLRRYHASVTLDPTRVGRDASQIADEVIAHLSGLLGADVRVSLEIQAASPSGFPESVVRTVTENGRTLKFDSQGFEAE